MTKLSAGQNTTGLNVQNVTITGERTIDANGETWWPFADKITFNNMLIRSRDGMFIQNVDTLLIQGIKIIPFDNPL